MATSVPDSRGFLIQTDSTGFPGVTLENPWLIFGTAVKQLRTACGLSRSALARRASVSESHLRNIENGQRRPTDTTAENLDEALGTDGLLIELAAAGDNEMRRRTILQSIAVLTLPVPMTEDVEAHQSDVEILGARLETYRRLDNAHGGSAIRTAVSSALRHEALPILSRRTSGSNEFELKRTVAELAQLAGWTAYDSGLYRESDTHFSTALSLALDIGDNALAAEVLAAQSHQEACQRSCELPHWRTRKVPAGGHLSSPEHD
ncbi:helix-turn-helix domain-containing protein [Salininema proteolyticum]|uniref:Helix-turn-helix domain-containing protein n=1 Tax=Salininema proteolyticum TaxID=1607685 RepID=A0ABV8TU91_9ACTN